MSDDEADPELLELLRQRLGITTKPRDEISDDTGVLKDAEYIYTHAVDVSIDMYGTKGAARSIYKAMQERGYSAQSWNGHPLHPSLSDAFSDIDLVNFIFTMDLLNFSFWSDLSEAERFQVEYRDKTWTGYSSLVACLRRALDEGIPITTPQFWVDARCSEKVFQHVFRSATAETIPLLNERISILREVGRILHETFGDTEGVSEANTTDTTASHTSLKAGDDSMGVASATPSSSVPDAGEDKQEAHDGSYMVPSCVETRSQPSYAVDLALDLSVVRLIDKASQSAGRLVNLVAAHFSAFRDEARFERKRVRLLKRAQIFVADLWAAFNGSGYGTFVDIGRLTMFADYRVPQILRSLGVLSYSPPLDTRIRTRQSIESGHGWEVQLRGCSIWAVELIRREIVQSHPTDVTLVNAVLIDFFLYDLAKEREAGDPNAMLPHHRTRSIWY